MRVYNLTLEIRSDEPRPGTSGTQTITGCGPFRIAPGSRNRHKKTNESLNCVRECVRSQNEYTLIRAKLLILMEPPIGVEPTTFRLRIERSTN